MSAYDMQSKLTFFFNLIKMDVMKSERNETLKVVDGYKFRFHKMLKNDIHRWCCTVKTYKCFLKFNDNNIYSDSFKDHTSHFKILE
jgi:hypothetical protein